VSIQGLPAFTHPLALMAGFFFLGIQLMQKGWSKERARENHLGEGGGIGREGRRQILVEQHFLVTTPTSLQFDPIERHLVVD